MEGYADDSELDDTDGDIADEILALTPVEVEELAESANKSLDLVDDGSGADEANLVCRAALEIIGRRRRVSMPSRP